MSCRKARKNFSALLDSLLDSQANQAIREHLSFCPACFKEFSFQQKISMALQVEEKKPAPAEFTQKVMAQIAAQNLGSKALRPHISKSAKIFLNNLNKKKVSRLRYGFAVAVLFFLFIGTSFGLTLKYPQYSFGPLKQIIAQNKKDSSSSLPKTGLRENKKAPAKINIATNNQPGVQNRKQPEAQNKEVKEQTSLNKNQPASGKVPDPKVSNGNNKGLKATVSVPEAKKPNPTTAKGDSSIKKMVNPTNKYEPRVFLNRPRVCESNLYKIKVDNLTRAQQKVQTLAKAAGISCHNLVQQQRDGKLISILRLETPVNQAKEFTSQILTIGKVYDQQIETKDLSARFAETLQRYQSLITQRQNAPTDQAKELEIQIKELENQLTAWDKEAQYQAVILWLEE
ncbi:MAG: zf-HC2 domain-containing protein [Peptococcaceae bacterium]